MKTRIPQPLDKRKRNIVDKKGFVKVKDAAALAVKRGFSYLWVDTCCIDKSSSAELSEAINSMYLWYQQSEECYAYLSDVKPAKEENWARGDSSLRRSRWFARGWTLQELIAPKSVHFYAKDWSLLGHKDGPIPFMNIISELTGIDGEVLDGRIDPLQLSISARMKWASHRETTRLEDTAYCLMGLFQVNMPLLYGEGHRAFTRLQEEIIQRTDDQSLYAWNSFDDAEEDPDALSGLLAHSPEQFKAAGNIQPLPPSPVYASAPSGMTNHGLRIQMFLRPILEADGVSMEEDYYAILDCFIQVGDLYQCPVICLRRLSQDQYARLQTKSRMLLPPMQAEFPEYEGYRTIYVRQQPVYYHLPQFRISPFHMHNEFNDKTRQDYKLTEIYPPRQWNSSTMTMKVKYSRKLQAMGVFRFQSPNSHDKKVDVVVGLRRLDAMQWEGWCFQRSCGVDPLELTLTSINQKVSDLTRAKKSVITSGMLRDSLGDDCRLLTDATVEGMQLQGRLYISISMSLKPEIQTSEVVRSLSTRTGYVFPTSESRIRVPFLRDFQVRTLTGPCSRNFGTAAPVFRALNGSGNADPLAVRGRPSPFSGTTVYDGTAEDDEIGFNAYHFMIPLHQFLDHVRDRKLLNDPPDPLDELALALFTGNSFDVERLLATDIELEAQTADVYGFAPLHWAVVGGFDESIHALLEKGADPFSVTREGWTAMHVAAIFNEPAWKAITHHISDEQLGKLAESRTKDHLETPLHLAAAYGSSHIGLSFFRDLSRDVLPHSTPFARNKYDETPFHRAAACNNVGILRTIVTERQYSRLCFVDYVDQYGRSPLWHAAATGALDAVKYLLSIQASINLTDDLGRSPLHAACRGGHHETVKCLLQEGARQSGETSVLGLTPLDYAAMFGHVECLETLLDFNSRHALLVSTPASLSLQNKALHIAASCRWPKCVMLLCSSGANPFRSYDHYLKLDEGKGFAIVIDKEGDALFASAEEGHATITAYMKACFSPVKVQEPSESDGDQAGRLNPGTQDLVDSNNQTSTQPVGLPQSAPPLSYAPPQSYSYGPQQSASYQGTSPSAGYSSLVPNRYTSASESYRDSLVARPSAPFTDKPSRIGSHSATLPAYSSPAYQGGSQNSNTHNSLQSIDPYPRAGSVQDLRQQSLGYTYSTPQPRSQSYAGNSLSYSYGAPQPGGSQSYGVIPRPVTEPGNRYPSLPAPHVPRPYHSEPAQPGSSGPAFYPQPILQTTSVLANLVHMLGNIGNPSMLLEDPPTDLRMRHYDSAINGFVYQVPEESAMMGLGIEELPVPVYELGAGDVPNNRFEPSVSVLPKIPEGGEPVARSSDENLEVPASAASLHLLSPLVSSIQTPGSWDRLG